MVFSTTHKLTLTTDKSVRIQKTTQRYLHCSQDKEQSGTQFLQTGVTMTKLNMASVKLLTFYEMCFIIYMHHYVCQVFANRITYDKAIG